MVDNDGADQQQGQDRTTNSSAPEGEEAAKIATFRDFTQVESTEEARRRLEYSNWDLQEAVDMFLAGRDIPTATTEAPSRPSGPPNSSSAQGRSGPLVPAGGGGSGAGRGWRLVLRILFFPFRAAMSLVSFLSKAVTSLLGLGQLVIEGESPAEATQRFIVNFEDQYGTSHPRFAAGSYSDALALAEREFKFLLVYLHSDRHYQSPRFCRNVLTNPNVIRYIDEAFIFWAGSVSSQEAAGAQHALGMSTFPFVAVVTSRRDRPYGRRVSVKQGPMDAPSLLSHLQSVLGRHGMSLVAARLEQEERVNARLLREEQDREYERALETDRARERAAAEEAARVREEEERRVREEARRVEEEEARVARRVAKAKALEERGEPGKVGGGVMGAGEVAAIVMRLPDGTRASRRFWGTDAMGMVFDWADVQGVDVGLARLVSSYPRRVLSYPDDADMTVAEAGLVPSAMLVIEERLED